MIESLIGELETNLRILGRQREGLSHFPIDKRGAFATYHAEAFHALRTGDPELYLEITKRSENIIEAYQNLFLLNELRGKFFEALVFHYSPKAVKRLPLSTNAFRGILGNLINETDRLIYSSIEELKYIVKHT